MSAYRSSLFWSLKKEVPEKLPYNLMTSAMVPQPGFLGLGQSATNGVDFQCPPSGQRLVEQVELAGTAHL